MATCNLSLGNTADHTADHTADTTAYPTRSHLQMLTCDHISKSDQPYVLLMTTQNFPFAKL